MAIDIPNIEAPSAEPDFMKSWRSQNMLKKEMLEAKMKQLENKYYPQKTMAQVASQLTYANLMGPQYLAGLMKIPDFVANLSEEQKNAIQTMITKAGMNQTNSTQNLTAPVTGQNPPQQTPPSPMSGQNAMQRPESVTPFQAPAMPSPNALAENGQRGYDEQLTPEQQKQINALAPGNTYVDELNQEYQRKNGAQPSAPAAPAAPAAPEYKPTYAENAAKYHDIINEGKALGTARGNAIADIGKEQLNFSKSEAVLNRINKLFQNPILRNMRDKIQFFQDKQLKFLSKEGTKEEKKMIGDLVSSLQAYKASTINSFSGKTLEKEFGLADQIKPDENDTVDVAMGKVRSLANLERIAKTKNDYILDLMSGPKHMDLGKATKEAEKMIDYDSIEKEVEDFIYPPAKTVTIKNKKTGEKRTLSLDEARKLGVPNV